MNVNLNINLINVCVCVLGGVHLVQGEMGNKKKSGIFVVFCFFHSDTISHRNDNMFVTNTAAHSSSLPVSKERSSILFGQSCTG